MQKEKDIEFGKAKEKELLPRLRERFDMTLEVDTFEYAGLDYLGKAWCGELKSRRNSLKAYPTTMIGANKLEEAKKALLPTFFAFSFTDGDYYWIYNEADIENGNVIFAVGGRGDRGSKERQQYAYIKTSILQRL